MPRITRIYPYHDQVIADSNDLRGIDLWDAAYDLYSLVGCLRNPEDPPVHGYAIVDGALQPVCRECRSNPRISACTMCAACCGLHHFNCDRCGCHRSQPSRCAACSLCDMCCTCPQYCDHEGCHNLVCECDSTDCANHCYDCRNSVAYYAHVTQVWEAPRREKGCRRKVGVEWEHNDPVGLKSWIDKWGGGYYRDGSCGFEAVTPPLAGEYIYTCLHELGTKLREVEIDARCSAHVHVDAGDLRWSDMYRLLFVYAKVEPVLYALAGQQRMENTYCIPVGPAYLDALKASDRKGAILAVALGAVDGRDRMRNMAEKKSGARYRGLNLSPWLYGKKHKAPDSTVEFRIHANTKDPERLANWASLLARLVEWCVTHNDSDASALPPSATRTLCTIAPDMGSWILKRIIEWRKATRANPGLSHTARRVKYNPAIGYSIPDKWTKAARPH